MLNERRNCFLGRWKGADGLRTWPTIGEALLRECPSTPAKGCFGLGGPMTGICGNFFSCCGDETKHSSRDMEGTVDTDDPLPNWKAGS